MEKIEELFMRPWSERVNILYYLRCGCFLELFSRKKRGASDEEEEELQALDVSVEQLSVSSSNSSLDDHEDNHESYDVVDDPDNSVTKV